MAGTLDNKQIQGLLLTTFLALFAVAIYYLMVSGQIYIASLLFLPVVLFYLNKQRWLLPVFGIVIYLILVNFLYDIGVTGRFKSLGYFLFSIMFLIVLAVKILRKDKIEWGFGILYYSIFQVFLSTILSESYGIPTHILTYVSSFNAIPLFLVLINSEIDAKKYDYSIWFVVILSLINIPINLYYFNIVKAPGDGVRGIFDGTLSSANTLQVAPCIFSSTFFLVKYLVTRKYKYLILTPVFIITLFLTQSKGGYYIYGLTLLTAGILYLSANLKVSHLVRIVIFIVLVMASINYLQRRWIMWFADVSTSETFSEEQKVTLEPGIFDIEYLSKYDQTQLTLEEAVDRKYVWSRSFTFKYRYGLVARDFKTFMFGYGFASPVHPSWEPNQSDIYNKVNIFTSPSTSIFNWIIGIGVLGVIFIMLINIYFPLNIYYHRKFISTLPDNQRALIYLFGATNVSFILLTIYAAAWENIYISAPFAILMALYFNIMKRRKETQPYI